MAQKTENEETEFKVVPDTTITLLCVNCGVATNNSASCQKCLSSPKPPLKSFRSSSVFKTLPETNPNPAGTSRDLTKSAAEPIKRVVNRCSGCRRKVGLTGFRCRCGDLFCADHRYSDRHECSYDYKTAGREAIARENPVVKAAKIVKI